MELTQDFLLVGATDKNTIDSGNDDGYQKLITATQTPGKKQVQFAVDERSKDLVDQEKPVSFKNA